jgi:DNA-binding SARP family transcriptional activator/tetratricopeptide (TPR) repeat protein
MIRISLVGEVSVSRNFDRIALRRKEAALVAYLALQSGVPASREQLATLLWGDRDEGAARHSLRQALLVLRRELGDTLSESSLGLVLAEGQFDVDLIRVEEQLGRMELGDTLPPMPERALAGLDDLGTEPFAEWTATRRAAYRARWREALLRVRDEAATAARWSDAERAARALAADQPLDLESVRQLVRTLRRAGAHGEAAAALVTAMTRFAQSGVDAAPLTELARSLPTQPGGALTDGRSVLSRLDLVGRQREMDALVGAWRDAVAPGGGVLVTGIDGSGRSRLVLDFTRSLSSTERRVIWVAAANIGAVAVRAAARVARALLDARGAAAADPEVVSRVRERLAADAPPPAADVTALLTAVAAERPVVLVLDDADFWAAEDEALRHALLAPGPRVLTIAVSLAELPAPRGTRRIAMEALTVSAVSQLIAAATGTPEGECRVAAEQLTEATAGHVQWLLDVIDATMLAPGTAAAPTPLATRALAAWSLPVPLPLSPALRSEILRRLDALSGDARRLLDLMADTPAGTTATELARHAGIAPAALTEALESLLRGQLARVGSHAQSTYHVAHPLIARVVGDALHPARLLPPPSHPRAASVRRQVRAAVILAAAVLAVTAGARIWRGRTADQAPRLVVLHELFTADTGQGTSLPVDAMLATNIARIRAVEVLLGGRPASASPVEARALFERAEFELTGAVARRTGGVRLTLRLTSRRDGRVRGGIVVEGPDLFAAVDQATAELAVLLGQPIPSSPLARVSTASLPAFQHFELGERARAAGDRPEAARFLREALRADTAFALARLRLAQVLGDFDKEGAHAQLDTALLATGRLPERERLLVRAWRAMIDEDPMREALADSIVAIWPLDPNGHLIQGQARAWRGAFLQAVDSFRRAIALDGPGLSGRDASCLACDAYEGVVTSLLLADSLDAAMRVALEWERRQPDGARAAATVSIVAQSGDRLGVAAAAARRVVALNPADEYAGVYDAAWAIRAGRPEQAVQLLDAETRHPSLARRRQATWFTAIAERNAGRPAEAEARLRRFMDALPPAARPAYVTLNLQRAQAMLEARQPRRAAVLFDSIADGAVAASPHLMGRLRAWYGTLAADAWVAAGDTSDLARRIREVEAWGSQSAYGRDRVLHHHLRGLQLEARGDLDGARRAFEAARWSPTGTYARTNLALVDVLLRLGRAYDALRVLEQASHGGLESVHLYGTRRDIHRRFAQAYRAAGRPDSAVVHERWLARASQ